MDTINPLNAPAYRRLDLVTIDIGEQYERRAWSRSFGISEDQLIEIVDKVGPSAEKIRALLRTKKNAGHLPGIYS